MAFSLVTNFLNNLKRERDEAQKTVSNLVQSAAKQVSQNITNAQNTATNGVNKASNRVNTTTTRAQNNVGNILDTFKRGYSQAPTNPQNFGQTFETMKRGAQISTPEFIKNIPRNTSTRVNQFLDAKPFDDALRGAAPIYRAGAKLSGVNFLNRLARGADKAAPYVEDMTVADLAAPIQAPVRVGAGAIMELLRGGDTRKKMQYTPKNIPEKLIFGSMPLQPLGDAVQQSVDVSQAANQYIAQKAGVENTPLSAQIASAGFAPALMGLAAGIDAVPGGRFVTKPAKELAENAASRIGAQAIKTAENATQEVTGGVSKLTEEARKYKSADEFTQNVSSKTIKENILPKYKEAFANPVIKKLDELGIPLNENGTVTLYHGTPAKNVASIEKNGFNGMTWFDSRKSAMTDMYSDNGKGKVFSVEVDPAALRANAGGQAYDDNFFVSQGRLVKDSDGIYRLSGEDLRLSAKNVVKKELDSTYSQAQATNTKTRVKSVKYLLGKSLAFLNKELTSASVITESRPRVAASNLSISNLSSSSTFLFPGKKSRTILLSFCFEIPLSACSIAISAN